MRHESYLVAWRDDHGRLKRVVKMLKGKVFFSDDYTYDGKGVLVEVRLIGVDGKTKVLRRTGGGTYE